MITDKMVDGINGQINAELYSAYLYKSMSAYASYNGMKGAANWFSIQTLEEMNHAIKLYDYMNSQGGLIVFDAIERPDADFKSLLDLFERALAHEQKVTAMFDNLASLAQEEKDHATGIFLQWFISEQVEEEENAREILDKIKLCGNGSGLFMIDKELESRIFTPPPAQA